MAKIKGVQSLSHLLVRLKITGMATGKGAVLMLVFFPVSPSNKKKRQNWRYGVQTRQLHLPATKQPQLCWVIAENCTKCLLGFLQHATSVSHASKALLALPVCPGNGKRK